MTAENCKLRGQEKAVKTKFTEITPKKDIVL